MRKIFHNIKNKHPKAFFLLIAVGILVFIDVVVFGGWRPYYPEKTPKHDLVYEEYYPEENTEPAFIKDHALLSFPAEMPDENKQQTIQIPAWPEKREPAWKKNAVQFYVPKNIPRIAVIIDDVGMNVANSQAVIDMEGQLTLAFLPYADHVREMALHARENGHEVMIHMPMQPMNDALDTGPIVLKTGMSPEVFEDMYQKALGSLDGYVGLNNHMGSRLTQDRPAMEHLMEDLKRDGLLFVDSRTIAASVADEVAEEYGVPHISRDVFLDDDPSLEAVRKSLARLERIARKIGYAVAIGHPKDNTIAALKEWIPTLEAKDIALVPISALVKVPEEKTNPDFPPLAGSNPDF